MFIKKKILIVDDDSMIGMEFKELLEEFGYEAEHILAWGNEITAQVKKNLFDLIIMDVRLKDSIDGISAAEIVRCFSNIPIAFMSGYMNPETLDRVKSISHAKFFPKPVDPVELKEAIDEFLGKEEKI